MASKLIDICSYAKGKTAVAGLTTQTYISTENMLPNKGGITTATNLPSIDQTQAYRKNDVLVSNIRPYFKKSGMLNTTEGVPTMCWYSAQPKVLTRLSYTMYWLMTPFSTTRQRHLKEQRCRVAIKARSWSIVFLPWILRRSAGLAHCSAA